jgi:hypothetical protein
MGAAAVWRPDVSRPATAPVGAAQRPADIGGPGSGQRRIHVKVAREKCRFIYGLTRTLLKTAAIVPGSCRLPSVELDGRGELRNTPLKPVVPESAPRAGDDCL